MLISPKQHEANIRNAEKSTGPQTPEGRQAVRFNALQHGLRARQVLLPHEDPAEFHQLCADLEAEWQPQTCTERLLLEQMAVSHWILGRLAFTENAAFAHTEVGIENQFSFLDRVAALRVRHERSFAKAMRDLEHLQQRRAKSALPETAQPVPEPVTPDPPRREPPPYPDNVTYIMAGAAASSPALPDTR